MKRDIYINGAAALSIQNTLHGFFPDGFVKMKHPFVQISDPDFKEYIPQIISRRMSKIIKRAISVSQIALRQAHITLPDAIIFGTGLGCIEDTEKFLNAVLDQNEQFLQPGFFIQSTHNTIASQVAIRLGCHGYNNTFVQRGLSFESALLDAFLLFEEGKVETVLTGGHDELTSTYFSLLHKAGYYSYNEENGIGNFAGEGSVSFVLSSKVTEESYAKIEQFEILYTPNRTTSFGSVVLPFLDCHNIRVDELSVIFSAYTEDDMGKSVYKDIFAPPFAKLVHIPFKAFCGEFFCASAFGLWMASYFVRNGLLPTLFMESRVQPATLSNKKYVLLHNHSYNKHHSLILLRKKHTTS